MTEVTIPDGGGASISLLEVEGRLYPKFPPESVKNVRSLKLRSDDLLMCTFPKAGTHWMGEILEMLTSGKAEFSPPGMEKERFMEILPPGGADSQPSPRKFGTHSSFSQMPSDLTEVKPKVVFVTRNIKDSAVSFYNHHKKIAMMYKYSGSWSDYFDGLFLKGKLDYGTWWDYHLDWEQGMKANPDLPVHIVYYEDLQEHPLRELRKLTTFLEKDYEEDFLQQVKDKCSFSSMKKVKGEQDFLKTPDGQPILYRKGEIGDWKNWFTVAQSEVLDAVLKDKMSNSMFAHRDTPTTN